MRALWSPRKQLACCLQSHPAEHHLAAIPSDPLNLWRGRTNSMRQSLERALSGLTSDLSADAGYEGSGYDAGGYGRRYSIGARPSADFTQSSFAGAGRRSGAYDGAAPAAANRREASFDGRTSFHSSYRCVLIRHATLPLVLCVSKPPARLQLMSDPAC